MSDANTANTAGLDLNSRIADLFDAVQPSGNNTRLHMFGFEPEHGREKLVLVVHGAEATLLMQLILEHAEPIFEKAEVV